MRNRAIAALGLLAVFGQLNISSAGESPAVKKSRNGVCHERGTVHFVQTKHFETFDSLQECLNSGGRRAYAIAPDIPNTIRPKNFVVAGYAIDWIWLIIGIVTFVAIAGPLIWRWWNKRKMRRGYRRFEQQARDRWSGHRLDSKVSGKTLDRSGTGAKGDQS